MLHSGPRLALPGRSRRRARVAQGELVLVHSWLRRCLDQRQAEDLSVRVLTRAVPPACIAAAPRGTRLRYLAVQEVLRARGVL